MDSVRVGSIMLFTPDDTEFGKVVAYDSNGKAIVPYHLLPVGFAKIVSVTDKGNYYEAEAKHVIHDIYRGISYKEAMKVLKHFQFEVGFDREFSDPNIGTTQHQMVLYHPSKSCVVFDTKGNPAHLGIACAVKQMSIYVTGGSPREGKDTTSVIKINPFDSYDKYAYKPLHEMDKMLKTIEKEKRPNTGWKGVSLPEMRCWADFAEKYVHPEDESIKNISLRKLRNATPECISIFEGCINYDMLVELSKRKDTE